LILFPLCSYRKGCHCELVICRSCGVAKIDAERWVRVPTLEPGVNAEAAIDSFSLEIRGRNAGGSDHWSLNSK
jgi:hypothetical protein